MKTNPCGMAGPTPSNFQIVTKNVLQRARVCAACLLPALVGTYCALVFYVNIAQRDFMHFAYMGYIATMASGFSVALKTDDSFADLRVLLDYAQLVLPITCHTTELWLFHKAAPTEICVLHAAFGIAAVIFFIVLEYKRQDITDLTLMLSIASMFVVGSMNENYIAMAAAMFFGTYYFAIKRKEECALKNQEWFNYFMMAFSLLTVAALNPTEYSVPSPLAITY